MIHSCLCLPPTPILTQLAVVPARWSRRINIYCSELCLIGIASVLSPRILYATETVACAADSLRLGKLCRKPSFFTDLPATTKKIASASPASSHYAVSLDNLESELKVSPLTARIKPVWETLCNPANIRSHWTVGTEGVPTQKVAKSKVILKGPRLGRWHIDEQEIVCETKVSAAIAEVWLMRPAAQTWERFERDFCRS